MKIRALLLPLAVFSLLFITAISTRSQTVVTFDDLPSSAGGLLITNDYQGLGWTNFGVVNAVLQTNLHGVNGAGYGMVSPSNVAVNAFGLPAEIDSPSSNFNFLSTYLTGAWNSNLNVEVQGFSGATLLYDTTVVASATSPTLFTFDYLNINGLAFISSGGQSAGFGGGSGEEFVMDNFTFEFIPEPSSLLLTILGAVTLWAVVKRKRG
jgi:hypothetical protein